MLGAEQSPGLQQGSLMQMQKEEQQGQVTGGQKSCQEVMQAQRAMDEAGVRAAVEELAEAVQAKEN